MLINLTMNVAIQSKHGESSIIIFSCEIINSMILLVKLDKLDNHVVSSPEDIDNQFSNISLTHAGHLLKNQLCRLQSR